MTREERSMLRFNRNSGLGLSRKERTLLNRHFGTRFRSNRKALLFLQRKMAELDPWTGRIDRFREFGALAPTEKRI